MSKPSTATFGNRKRAILKDLSKPDHLYSDHSPKGVVDAEIRDLVDTINNYEGLVTTSSCSGRISIFAEGIKGDATGIVHDQEANINGGQQLNQGRVKFASEGGKGGGGAWLYITHEPLKILDSGEWSCTQLFGLQLNSSTHEELILDPKTRRFVHFKFEPMILHILVASPAEARHVLAAAHEAGFRESGAANIPINSSSTSVKSGTIDVPIPIAIRTSGLAFDNIIGVAVDSAKGNQEQTEFRPLVSENHLRTLVGIANAKFELNIQRKHRFGELLATRMYRLSSEPSRQEAATTRRERKKIEGLEKKELIRRQQQINCDDLPEFAEEGSDDSMNIGFEY